MEVRGGVPRRTNVEKHETREYTEREALRRSLVVATKSAHILQNNGCGDEFIVRGEEIDNARLQELQVIAGNKMLENVTLVENGTSMSRNEITAENRDRMSRYWAEMFNPNNSWACTLTCQLPSNEKEYGSFTHMMRQRMTDVPEGSTKAGSFGTALRWAAKAIGITGPGWNWNLRRFVEELDTVSIRAAQASLDTSAHERIREHNNLYSLRAWIAKYEASTS